MEARASKTWVPKLELGNQRKTRPELIFQVVSKNELWSKVKKEAKSQPETYMKYFEDWRILGSKIRILVQGRGRPGF
jgi:hypothetical protein